MLPVWSSHILKGKELNDGISSINKDMLGVLFCYLDGKTIVA